MKIDPVKMTFHDLTDAEAAELKAYGETLLFGGSASEIPSWVHLWIMTCEVDHDVGQIIYPTLLPGRIFYSLFLRAEGRNEYHPQSSALQGQ
jgi:hypothetical protein